MFQALLFYAVLGSFFVPVCADWVPLCTPYARVKNNTAFPCVLVYRARRQENMGLSKQNVVVGSRMKQFGHVCIKNVAPNICFVKVNVG